MIRMEDTWARLEATEAALAELGSTTRAVASLVEKFRVDADTVRRWIAVVRRRWATERASVSREDRRAHLVAMVERIYASAMGNKQVVTDAEGNPRMVPQLDEQGQPVRDVFGQEKLVVAEVPAPDRRLALQAVDRLIDLEGLGSSNKHEVTVKNELISGTVVELARAAGEDNAALERAARHLLPEGTTVIDVVESDGN